MTTLLSIFTTVSKVIECISMAFVFGARIKSKRKSNKSIVFLLLFRYLKVDLEMLLDVNSTAKNPIQCVLFSRGDLAFGGVWEV